MRCPKPTGPRVRVCLTPRRLKARRLEEAGAPCEAGCAASPRRTTRAAASGSTAGRQGGAPSPQIWRSPGQLPLRPYAAGGLEALVPARGAVRCSTRPLRSRSTRGCNPSGAAGLHAFPVVQVEVRLRLTKTQGVLPKLNQHRRSQLVSLARAIVSSQRVESRWTPRDNAAGPAPSTTMPSASNDARKAGS